MTTLPDPLRSVLTETAVPVADLRELEEREETVHVALSSLASLRNEQVVVSGVHDTRRPAQRELRRG